VELTPPMLLLLLLLGPFILSPAADSSMHVSSTTADAGSSPARAFVCSSDRSQRGNRQNRRDAFSI
jgi:hypothetical protein